MPESQTQLLLAKYGNPAASKADEAAFTARFMILYNFPAWLLPYWPKYLKQGVKRQWFNKDLIAPLEAVFRELIASGLAAELKTYDGAWNIRIQRGSTSEISAHSFGNTLDFNAALNPRGAKLGSRPGMFTPAFIAVWKKHGFMAGADFPVPDAMHFQLLLAQPAPKPEPKEVAAELPADTCPEEPIA